MDSNMEFKVHKYLSSFLAKHSLQDSISNIDDIVLSYLLGVLDIIGQGDVDDCFDLEDVTDMMNAYLPGFDQIDRSSVTEWMFSMAARLKDPTKDNLEVKDNEPLPEETVIERNQVEEPTTHPKKNSFPKYEFNANNTQTNVANEKPAVNGTEKTTKQTESSIKSESHRVPPQLGENGAEIPSLTVDHHSLSQPYAKDLKTTVCKRKKRYTSVSSQDSQDDPSKPQLEIQADLDDCLVRNLLDMFPATCSMEAKHCLRVSNGDLNIAAQLIMDRQESDQAITDSRAASLNNSRKSKKTSEVKLDDEGVKLSIIGKYSFYDAEEEKRTHKPPPLKKEAKKLVRYRDGQIVSMKGERFSEIKKS